MLIRNVDPASANFQQVWIYDVIKPDPDKDEYVAQLSTAVSPGQTQAGVLGAIGGNLTVAGFAPVGGALGPFTDDMVMRDTANGALLLYSIRDDKLVPGAIGVPLTPPPSEPIAPTSTIGGIAIDLSVPTSGSTSQLVQAMAGLGGGWRSRFRLHRIGTMVCSADVGGSFEAKAGAQCCGFCSAA